MKLIHPISSDESPRPLQGVARTASRILFAALVSLFLISGTACEERSQFDEAVEEVQDEASDLKKKVKDEIDDHS